LPIEFPYTSRPEDLSKFLDLLPAAEVPAAEIDAAYFKSLGFSAASGRNLLQILKKLGFVDEAGIPSGAWAEYASAHNKGLVLASAITRAYAGLFKRNMCAYMDDDDSILDFLKSNVDASPRDLGLMLDTFRMLVEPADFQDLLCVAEDPVEPPTPVKDRIPAAEIKVNPNLQVSIQVHIDPATPDEKIETIFKNMRKYLLDKDDLIETTRAVKDDQ
jgi:hypothetical protein